MQINYQVLEAVKDANAQLLVVTKYWEADETKHIRAALKDEMCVVGWGENRTNSLAVKALPREETHFIGRLQSRQLPEIIEHCQVIHSLASLKHAAKIDKICEQNKYTKIEVFVQVNVALDPSKEGIEPEATEAFLVALKAYSHLEVVGLSSMGWGEFDEQAKRQEFKDLIMLRDKYLPAGKTSAGTSRDYGLALAEGINIVRVGKGILAASF